jgi:hypothetical protein
MNAGLADLLLIAQGVYYLASGVWPLIHMRSFLIVTGPKKDLWLVKTVGILITVIGATLTVAGARQETTLEIFILAVGSQLALAAVDVVYVAKKVIAKIYLLDAIVEAAFFALWCAWIAVNLARG